MGSGVHNHNQLWLLGDRGTYAQDIFHTEWIGMVCLSSPTGICSPKCWVCLLTWAPPHAAVGTYRSCR